MSTSSVENLLAAPWNRCRGVVAHLDHHALEVCADRVKTTVPSDPGHSRRVVQRVICAAGLSPRAGLCKGV